MSLSGAQVSGDMALAATFFGWNGTSMNRLAQVVGQAVYEWAIIPTNMALTGNVKGTAGAGKVSGKLIVPPGADIILVEFKASGIEGTQAASLASLVSTGVSMAFTKAGQYEGTSTGVSIGVDNSKVSLVNAKTLGFQLMASLSQVFGAQGTAASLLFSAMSKGIAKQLKRGTGVGAVTPVTAGVFPSTGTSASKVV